MTNQASIYTKTLKKTEEANKMSNEYLPEKCRHETIKILNTTFHHKCKEHNGKKIREHKANIQECKEY